MSAVRSHLTLNFKQFLNHIEKSIRIRRDVPDTRALTLSRKFYCTIHIYEVYLQQIELTLINLGNFRIISAVSNYVGERCMLSLQCRKYKNPVNWGVEFVAAIFNIRV